MSKLHETYLSLKEEKEKAIEDTSFYFSESFWDTIMIPIQDLQYTLFLKNIADWYAIYVKPYVLFINKEHPQICKCQKAEIRSNDSFEDIKITKDLNECDELRCPAKYDNVLTELAYVLEKQIC